MSKAFISWVKSHAGWILLVAAALIGAYFLWHWWFAQAAPKYLTAKVARATLESDVLATGALQAIRQVDVGTRATGQLKSLKVKLGDHVQAGDLLAEIDPVLPENDLRAQQANLANLEAQKRAAEARLRKSRLELARQKGMIGGAATSRRDLESADAQSQADEAGLAALDAQIAQARAQTAFAATNLSYTKITAPIEGEVVAILTQEGQTVVATQIVPVILKLANLDAMTVKTQVSEADVIKVHVGQPVSFTILGDQDKRYGGKLRAVEPAPENYSNPAAATAASGQQSPTSAANVAVFYNALFDVPNSGHFLRIGMTAQVSIELGDAHDALVVPSAALRDRRADGRYDVRVLKPGGDVETKPVSIGLDNFVQAEVLEGLAEGETVIAGEPEQPAAGAGK
ncbi:MAG: efflux RND transporter periplasmic adaptor subunit [Roseiarcus sp.]